MATYKCTGCDNKCIFSVPIQTRDPWLCPLRGVTVKWEDHVEDYARHDVEQTMIAQNNIRQDVEKLIEKYSENDAVNKPSHYCEGRKFEPADVAEDWELDKDAYLFNVFTYIARAGRKDDIVQDLEKARWYLDRRIKCLKESRE